ncbi:unnamed protein product, partial [marine sediment metagenome]
MTRKQKREMVRKGVKQHARAAKALAGRIWELAEPPMREVGSARLLGDFLGERGFKVDFCLPALPTAFKATAGKGKPAIGILGEYDALPDCGLRKGTYGHGCGHNLFGVASAVGA